MQMYIALLLKGNKRLFAPGKLTAHIRLQIQYYVPFYLIIMICFTIMVCNINFLNQNNFAHALMTYLPV